VREAPAESRLVFVMGPDAEDVVDELSVAARKAIVDPYSRLAADQSRVRDDRRRIDTLKASLTAAASGGAK
jgi:hypothetical protein